MVKSKQATGEQATSGQATSWQATSGQATDEQVTRGKDSEGEALFSDQMKDSFAFFTALTAAAMEALAALRKH